MLLRLRSRSINVLEHFDELNSDQLVHSVISASKSATKADDKQSSLSNPIFETTIRTEIMSAVKIKDVRPFIGSLKTNLSINRNQIFCLVGPSGCGKSSLCLAILSMNNNAKSQGKIELFGDEKNEEIHIPGKDVGM